MDTQIETEIATIQIPAESVAISVPKTPQQIRNQKYYLAHKKHYLEVVCIYGAANKERTF